MRHPPRSGLLRVAAHAPPPAGVSGDGTCAPSVFSSSDSTSVSLGPGPSDTPRALDGTLDG
ncbi:hypothetical protein GCM10017589_20280 [Streptomyces poonensis]|nr:hypothetical protein GCM10017589_20280 [Streptomyces poonensis]